MTNIKLVEAKVRAETKPAAVRRPAASKPRRPAQHQNRTYVRAKLFENARQVYKGKDDQFLKELGGRQAARLLMINRELNERGFPYLAPALQEALVQFVKGALPVWKEKKHATQETSSTDSLPPPTGDDAGEAVRRDSVEG